MKKQTKAKKTEKIESSDEVLDIRSPRWVLGDPMDIMWRLRLRRLRAEGRLDQ